MVRAKSHIAVSAIFAISLLGCAQATKIYGSDGLPAPRHVQPNVERRLFQLVL